MLSVNSLSQILWIFLTLQIRSIHNTDRMHLVVVRPHQSRKEHHPFGDLLVSEAEVVTDVADSKHPQDRQHPLGGCWRETQRQEEADDGAQGFKLPFPWSRALSLGA